MVADWHSSQEHYVAWFWNPGGECCHHLPHPFPATSGNYQWWSKIWNSVVCKDREGRDEWQQCSTPGAKVMLTSLADCMQHTGYQLDSPALKYSPNNPKPSTILTQRIPHVYYIQWKHWNWFEKMLWWFEWGDAVTVLQLCELRHDLLAHQFMISVYL